MTKGALEKLKRSFNSEPSELVLSPDSETSESRVVQPFYKLRAVTPNSRSPGVWILITLDLVVKVSCPMPLMLLESQSLKMRTILNAFKNNMLTSWNKVILMPLRLELLKLIINLVSLGKRKMRTFTRFSLQDFKSFPYGPRQANLLLIAYASSEGSGEPAHPRSLARTFAARSYKQWVKRNLQTESQIPAPLNGWACAVEICHDGMLEDTNSLDGAHIIINQVSFIKVRYKMFNWSFQSSLRYVYGSIFYKTQITELDSRCHRNGMQCIMIEAIFE